MGRKALIFTYARSVVNPVTFGGKMNEFLPWLIAGLVIAGDIALPLRPLATQNSGIAGELANELNSRSEVRAQDYEKFEVLIRRTRIELSRYLIIVNTHKLRNPEQGEHLWERLFDLRIFWNTVHPANNFEYPRWREVKDGIILLLMQVAGDILELDQFGSYDYQGWEILASARRFVVKLRAVPLKEITNRQLLEDMLEGLEGASDFISGVDAEDYKEEIDFVWGGIQSTRQNIVARIAELEQQRSEIRGAA